MYIYIYNPLHRDRWRTSGPLWVCSPIWAGVRKWGPGVIYASILCRHQLFNGGSLWDSVRASPMCMCGCLLLCDCLKGRRGCGQVCSVTANYPGCV